MKSQSCCQLALLVGLFFVLVKESSAQQSADAPVKYAPSYCLRFRLNCNRPEKKKHVCCLYPLPDGGSNTDQRKTGPNYGTAVKFRPAKLPCTKKKPEEPVVTVTQRSNKKPTPPKKLSPVTPGPKKKPGKTNPRSPTSRPRICQRLVVDCKNSPKHRCCRYLQQPENPVSVEPVIFTSTVPEITTLKDIILPDVNDRNRVDVDAVPVLVTGEAIPVPLETPEIVEERKKLEQIINEGVTAGVPISEAPYDRIPAECFTETFDCQQDPNHYCCSFLER